MSFDQLLFAGESQTLEYKASFDKATVESLVAVANAKGGSVLVGVKDNGEVRVQRWGHSLPPLRLHFRPNL